MMPRVFQCFPGSGCPCFIIPDQSRPHPRTEITRRGGDSAPLTRMHFAFEDHSAQGEQMLSLHPESFCPMAELKNLFLLKYNCQS